MSLDPKIVLRVEMAKRGLRYVDLQRGLALQGVEINLRVLRNKGARGVFSATFFLQCMIALGVTQLRLNDYP